MPEQPTTPTKTRKPRGRVAWVLGALLALSMANLVRDREGADSAITLSEAMSRIEDGGVATLRLDDGRRIGVLEPRDTKAAREQFAYPENFAEKLVETAQRNKTEVEAVAVPGPNYVVETVFMLLPLLLGMGLVFLLLRKVGGLSGAVGKLPTGRGEAVPVPETRFGDVAGLAEVVEELREVTEYLHHPERFARMGAKVPKGFLLVGPPGTGKTLLARAVAGEAGVPFFALSGSDFVETFVGVGASRVRSLFEQARKAGKAIVFIDELDAVGRSRGNGPVTGSNEESERTLNALLVELDGFTTSQVIVLAATNRPEILDPALLRPGRFDRRILVPLPDRVGRAKILELQARSRTMAPGIDFEAFARRCVGMSGADLGFVINEAALEAARRGAEAIGQEHLDAALAVATLGRERRSAVVSDKDRTLTAWHEAGHAAVALVEQHADDPTSVTIIPRGMAGGATWFGGEDQSYISKHQAYAQLAVAFGGRAGEELLVGDDFTSGAAGDLRQATALAHKMVCEWGMVGDALAYREPGLLGNDRVVNELIDATLRQAMDRARAVLAEHAGLHLAIAQRLLDDETIDEMVIAQLYAHHRERRDGAGDGPVGYDPVEAPVDLPVR